MPQWSCPAHFGRRNDRNGEAGQLPIGQSSQRCWFDEHPVRNQRRPALCFEVNPRASRTVFVSKAIGVPLAKLAAKLMTGKTLPELGFTEEMTPKHWCIKESVFPFVRFPGTTIRLGPEMRSTGEVMGLDTDFGIAFAKPSSRKAQPAH